MITTVPHAGTNNISLEELQFVISPTCTQTRSLVSIVLTCITTLFACTWTAIHPNIPGPNETGRTVALRRLCIMLLALVIPEIVLTWALHQLLDARITYRHFNKALQEGTTELRVKYGSVPRLVGRSVPLEVDEQKIEWDDKPTVVWHESLKIFYYHMISMIPGTFVHKQITPASDPMPECYRWTMKHSFFAWMGGFMLFTNGGPHVHQAYAPLTPHELLEFIEADSVHVPMISEKEIDDRSKGDWLSKTVAFLQLSWFILQFTARSVERLPATQLEVDTLAICILSCFTYLAWWYKPKDVHCTIPVYWKKSHPLAPGKTAHSHTKKIAQMVTAACFDSPGEIPPWTLKLLRVAQPFLDCLGLGTTSATCVKEHRVPTLGGYQPEVTFTEGRLIWNWKRTAVLAVATIPAAFVFVAIHFIAWDSFFPSHVEQLLWRIAVSGMLGAILLFLPLCIYILLLARKMKGRVTKQSVWIMQAMVILGGLPYLVFRLFTIVLMVMSLRSVDPGVHEVICWTSMIPHL